MRHPRSTRLARTRAQRWGLWIVLALLVLVPITVCQPATSPRTADVSVVVAASCDGNIGHDVMCARGLAAAAMPGARGGRDDVMRLGIGALVAGVALAGVVFASGTGVSARYPRRAGPPPWASQQLVPGRHQLVAIGITRI